jgi:hypothetical protein
VAAGTSCYRFSPEEVDWPVAEAACEADGAHLVIVDDADEAAQIDAIAPIDNAAHWIGVTDIVVEGAYLDVTGQPAWLAPWDTNEPLGSAEDCLMIAPDEPVLLDQPCDASDDYLCEYDGLAVDPTAF